LNDSVSTPSSSRLVTGARREQPGLRGGHRHRDEQRHQQRESQRDDVDALQPVARDRELAVVAIGRFDRLGALGERRRHALAQLQEPHFPGKVHRHHDAQRQRTPHGRVHDGVGALGARLPQRLCRG
jgi:hypothetical protein